MEENKINRVPPILWIYWVIKISSTTLGETAADMFSMTFQVGYGQTILLFMGLFCLFLIYKIYQKKYEPVSYWLVFTASAIVGTAISDYIDRTLGLGYAVGSALLVMSLFVVLLTWYQQTRSISVEKIYTSKVELFYWAAFLVANTLGTAAGDYLSDDLKIGFLQSALLLAILLVLMIFLHYYTQVSGLLLFWAAFVLTRPFGATFGDLFTKTPLKGGLGVGTIWTSGFFGILLIASIYAEKKRVSRILTAPEEPLN